MSLVTLVLTVGLMLWPSCSRREDDSSRQGGGSETEAPARVGKNAAGGGAAGQPGPQLPTTELTVGGDVFEVELAFTESARRRGLMFRSELADRKGMLFLFANSQRRSFYMKNCLIDLDILFLDHTGRIVSIRTMTAPKPGEPLTYYHSDAPARYALELPAGTAAELGIQPGQVISLPRTVTRIIPQR